MVFICDITDGIPHKSIATLKDDINSIYNNFWSLFRDEQAKNIICNAIIYYHFIPQNFSKIMKELEDSNNTVKMEELHNVMQADLILAKTPFF